ncbi:hypothetical protein [Pengzhenrongella phosphoraccumulans]|uniref:hypothetical protein n=1 Tax=Pengzhenrongella phosphoraccumulans TaxID=3114394 RepID=UPI00388D1874
MPRRCANTYIRRVAGVESWASSASTRSVMMANCGRNTKPEVTLRKVLLRAGMRFRVNYRTADAPRRTIDVAFPRQRVEVFVDGFFWHGFAAQHRPVPPKPGPVSSSLGRVLCCDDRPDHP